MTLRARLERLPKAELHVHLRGAIPPAVLAALMTRYPLPDLLARDPDQRRRDRIAGVENLRPFLTRRRVRVADLTELFRYRDFETFLLSFWFTGLFIRQPEDFQLLLDGVLDELARQQIVYAEVTVSLPEYLAQGLAWETLLELLDAAAGRLRPRVQWIVDPVRNFGHEAAEALVARLAAARPASVVGITLGGSEGRFPPGPFQRAYLAAERAGLRRSVHAGEGLGPESVREALELLHAERIGHGVRAVEDPALVARLVAERIPLEVSPTSNLCTGIYPSREAHPLRQLVAAGVEVNLNTDDPTFFHVALVDELVHAREQGLGEAEVRGLALNGFRHAFLPDDEKQALLSAAEAAWDAPTA